MLLQSTIEAQFLASQLQLYYGTNQADRYALVKQFNHDPQNFDYKQVLAQLQNTSVVIEENKNTHTSD